MPRQDQKLTYLERISNKLTDWVGTPASIVVHTIMFIGIFSLKFVGMTIDQILLILTTLVSLEAIYLAIFIQMTVNRNTQALEGVEENIEEIQEDVEDIQEDVGEIDKDVDTLHTSVKEISKDVDEMSDDVEELSQDVEGISEDIEQLQDEETDIPEDVAPDLALQKIQDQLQLIMQELQDLKKRP